MSSKYEKGKVIESIDLMLQQSHVYLDDKVYSRGWFIGWKLGWVDMWIKLHKIHYAIRIKKKENDNE